MAMSFEKLSPVCYASTHRLAVGDQVGEFQRYGAVRPLLCSEGGVLVVNSGQSRGRRDIGEVVARISRETASKNLSAKGLKATRRVAGLASDSTVGASSDLDENCQSSGNSAAGDNLGDEESLKTASAVPRVTSQEDAKAVASEVTLSGDDLSVIEYPGKDEAQRDPHPINSFADSVLNNLHGDGRDFSLTDVGGLWKTGEDAGEVKVPELSVSAFDVKDGVSPLEQWTSTELTMEHSQLARITTDVKYMQCAFAFFGVVRFVEAILTVYSTSPPDYGKLKEFLNILDPFTISWLAHNVREPMEGLATVDPLDLEEVITLRTSLWDALHKFYERQWKVMATIAMVRSLGLITSHVPTADAVTSKVQVLWNALMALPVF